VSTTAHPAESLFPSDNGYNSSENFN